MRAAITILVAVLPLQAAAQTGRVMAARSHWAGDVIVTDLDVRLDSGTQVSVTQLGGTVDGIGMSFSHLVAPARVGDTLDVDGARRAVVATRAGAADVTGAAYGLQRTTLSHRPLRRATRDIRFVYDAAGTAHIPGQLELAAIDDAFASWMLATEACGGLRYHHAIVANVPTAFDGVDTVHFLDDRWCRPATATSAELCYPAAATAVTKLAFVDNPDDPDDGTIIEADIDINSVDFALQIDGATNTWAAPSMDLVGVATHELGHALGLAHDCANGDDVPADASGAIVPRCDAADVDHVAATMFASMDPGDNSKRTLEASDRAAACAVLDDVPIPPTLEGGCSSTHGAGAWLLLAIVPLMAGRRRRPTAPVRGDGDLLAGKYQVLERIGQGGMATVHRAIQRGVAGYSRVVAIKRVSPQHDGNIDLVGWFIHEARIASTLSHRSIIQIYDFGTSSDGLYIAMEHVEGRSLLELARHAIKHGAHVPVDVVLAIAIELCDALDHVHTRVGADGAPLELVHRDISLANVLVTAEGHLKLIDFGVASGRGFEAPSRGIVGKPSYVAPEMIRTQTADARADLYGAGVVMWELLAGTPLFHGANTAATLSNVLRAPVAPPSALRADCPTELDTIIAAVLDRNPARRPASAAMLRDQLVAVARANEYDRGAARLASWLASPHLAGLWAPRTPHVDTSVTTPCAPPDEASAACTIDMPRFAEPSGAETVEAPRYEARAATDAETEAVPKLDPTDLVQRFERADVDAPVVAVRFPAIAMAPLPPTVQVPRFASGVLARPRHRRVPATAAAVLGLAIAALLVLVNITPSSAAITPIAEPAPPAAAPALDATVSPLIRPDQVTVQASTSVRLDGKRLAAERVHLALVSALICIDTAGAVTSVHVLNTVPAWISEAVASDLHAMRFSIYRPRGTPESACFTKQLPVRPSASPK